MAAMKSLCVFACLSATLLAGCDPNQNGSGNYVGPRITPRRSWVAGGTLPNAALAIDGEVSTAAACESQNAAPELIIDLHEPCEFQSVWIDHGHNEMGYARKLAIATSMDGNSYLDRYVGPDTRRMAILALPGPVLARFIRIKVIIAGLQPWSVAEVSLQ
jgi:hypothetical protein